MVTFDANAVKGQTCLVDITGMNVIGGQFELLSRLIDTSATRQKVIGGNIANVNTPGYQRQEVTFESELAELLKAGKVNDVRDLEAKIITTPGLKARKDGNTVDMDMEMGALSKNSVLFETYSQLMATKVGMMRSAISGRA